MARSQIAPLKRSLTILIQILIIPLASIYYTTTASSSPINNNFISPVRNLEASLAASAAHTTVVAVQSYRNNYSDDRESNNDDDDNGEDCIVLLSRTPHVNGRETLFNLTRSSSSIQTIPPVPSKDGRLIPIFSRGSIQMPFHRTTPTHDSDDNDNDEPQQQTRENHNLHILQPSSGLCLAVTGFALDKTHLVRYAAELVSSHEYVYGWGGGGGGGESTTSFDVHRMVREDLASKMREAAFVGGDRPFGVDLLVVGSDHRSRRRGGSSDANRSQTSMVVYTIDPSGNWKHWGGGGTCIGKGADRVRKQLYKTLYCNDDDGDDDGDDAVDKSRPPATWVRALEVAMEATYRAMDVHENTSASDGKKGGSNEIPTADYDAIVLFGNDNDEGREEGGSSPPPRCAVIDRRLIADVYRKCVVDNARQKDKLKN